MTYSDSLPTATGYLGSYPGTLTLHSSGTIKGEFRMNRNANEDGLRQYLDLDITDTFTFWTANGIPTLLRKGDIKQFSPDSNA